MHCTTTFHQCALRSSFNIIYSLPPLSFSNQCNPLALVKLSLSKASYLLAIYICHNQPFSCSFQYQKASCPFEIGAILEGATYSLTRKKCTFLARLIATILPSLSLPLYTSPNPPCPILFDGEKLPVPLLSSSIVNIIAPVGFCCKLFLDE